MSVFDPKRTLPKLKSNLENVGRSDCATVRINCWLKPSSSELVARGIFEAPVLRRVQRLARGNTSISRNIEADEYVALNRIR